MPNKLNPEEWAHELSQLGKAWPAAAADIFYRYVALLALKGVIYRSPVGDPDLWKSPAPKGYVGGQFRGNWDVAAGAPTPSGTPSGVDPSGDATFSSGSAVINASIRGPKYNDIWLLNNLPYAIRLEEGWSTQAPGPGGIVEVTADEIVDAAVPNVHFRIMKDTT